MPQSTSWHGRQGTGGVYLGGAEPACSPASPITRRAIDELLWPGSWERYGLKPWIEAAARRLHHNVLAIALANKLARIAWSVLHHGRNFEVRKMSEPVSQPA
jgi:hypothetical protein